MESIVILLLAVIIWQRYRIIKLEKYFNAEAERYDRLIAIHKRALKWYQIRRAR